MPLPPLIRPSSLQAPRLIRALFAPFVKIRGLKILTNAYTSVKKLPIFTRPKTAPIHALLPPTTQSKPLARRHNKAIRQHPYCVSRQNKEVSQRNKETDGQMKTHFQEKQAEKVAKMHQTVSSCQLFINFSFPQKNTIAKKSRRFYWCLIFQPLHTCTTM